MRSLTPFLEFSTTREIEIAIVPEAPALVDTDVASALYVQRYYGHRVPASLAATLRNRRLAISLITLGEAKNRALLTHLPVTNSVTRRTNA
jgi:hypothetical protein